MFVQLLGDFYETKAEHFTINYFSFHMVARM